VNVLATTNDFIVWYAKDLSKLKYRQLYLEKDISELRGYSQAEDRLSGVSRKLSKAEISDPESIALSLRIFQQENLTSSGHSETLSKPFEYRKSLYSPATGNHWKTTANGLANLVRVTRLVGGGKTLNYKRYLDDFPVYPLTHIWQDISVGFGGDSKAYVVQTSSQVLERCLLMTTDPGDLVLDPTCGSGTTAFVAEKWGRRWITCDTSRVAVTLAKQRLMTASYDYFSLRYPHEGLKGGFIYKTVPHVTLKSIANNPEIDEIYERMHPAVDAALAEINKSIPHPNPLPKGEGVLKEWEVPFDFPADWPKAARKSFDAFHTARQSMQKQMDASIAAHADQETLYDQPQVAKNKLRITGPFTVEAVPFPSVKGLENSLSTGIANGRSEFEADTSIARTGESGRQHQWREELLKAGIRGKGGQMLKFAELETLPYDDGIRNLHAVGHLDSGERVVVSFGPEYAALEQRQVENAVNEAGKLFPLPKMIVFCAFAFDPEAAKDIDQFIGIIALKVQMNTDLLTEDLKKAKSSNQSFWLMGQPEVVPRKLKDGKYEVEVYGFDYFDTVKGELVSGGKNKIAMWSLDTDYDERSLFPRQVFFPMAGKGEGWDKLKKNIRTELNEDLLGQFQGTVSLPFEAGENRKIAVKIVDDRGIESLKVMLLP
jgi:adenine-specific DNA-methyltransferase